ncbi:MAG: tRNA (adenosine(37)-N6)-threonylcarbamoyltransferase complex ATPase subunit type 1 TsaE [Candidatus Zambryskibacteria bacterium]|nr:tRNA (adenosine(37)-N6)-threonylcarbamoyltransferase complex ATPase subunit type 1 TsaE [Candidatus Zambryskibacteria bacterium]
MKHTSSSLEDTQKIADGFVVNLSPKNDSAVVVGLYGNLGAGKTAFTKCVASSLGVPDSITSPTFVIEKIYVLKNQKFTHLIHIDAYRLEKAEELLHLGWKEIISDPKNLILIEWPENVADIMPEHIKISLNPLENPNSREIEILN